MEHKNTLANTLKKKKKLLGILLVTQKGTLMINRLKLKITTFFNKYLSWLLFSLCVISK